VSTKLARFTQLACPALERCAESTARRRLPSVRSRQGAGPLPCSTVNDSGWEPDGVTLQVRFCEEPGAEPSHGRDIVAPSGNQAANRENKLLPKRRQGPGLLSGSIPIRPGVRFVVAFG
jgi:hypothetical protein